MDSTVSRPRPVQRIVKVRRDYNRWVSDESLEDYALRFAPRGFRKWSAFRVANTAFGAVSFLALEAIGAAISMTYGFTNAVWAIGVVSLVIFLTGLPIAYHAARRGLDMDLLARGAGFGYLGSTLTSLIYASFTFIFFALEAAIMAQAFELWFDLPRPIGYVVSALIVIPMVTHGVTLISRLQLWTQPVWLLLLVLPYLAIALKDPGAFGEFASLNGRAGEGDTFSWTAFGAAATVAASLIAQIGEQVDFLRFMPEPTKANRVRWWCAVVIAGPGWIVLGAAKMVGGAFLAFLALQNEIPVERALEPTQMYLAGFAYVVGAGGLSVALAGLFVIVSQVKINVTNAYAGSLAWSNFFARLTHSHPGRVVWLLFNVAIAVLLMVMGVFEALERVLAFYAHLAVAWVGAIVGDLVIAKPLGLSPTRIEFRRAYLHDINPAGFGAMGLGSVLSVLAYAGVFGESMRAASAGIALAVSLVAAPAIAWATGGRWYVAREPVDFGPRHPTLRCAVCRNRFESDDMAQCPAYGGAICSLCCTLDARCGDRCKGEGPPSVADGLLARLLPRDTQPEHVRRIGRFASVLAVSVAVFGAMLWLLYAQEMLHLAGGGEFGPGHVDLLFVKLAAGLLLVAAVAAWWLVLAAESRQVAQQESERQNQLLQREIDAHRQTDALLAGAKEIAESANLAKSRFLTGMSHEMRAPLNSILGYSQLLLRDGGLDADRRASVDTILRSGEHLAGLVDGLLELSRIEHGKLRIDPRSVDLAGVLAQVVRMFEPLAEAKGLAFRYEVDGPLPARVHADPKRLRQVLINLLSNAVKFTESGSVSLRVRHVREIGHIDVTDTGIGVAPADQDRIFRPFERLAPASVEGTGLGLTITQLLVELMGGDIRVRSAPGRGSCFQVRVYLPSVAGAPAGTQADARIVGYEGPRRRVLVVDDEPAHRAVLRRMIEPLGFEVAEAPGARACLEAVARERPALVLLDVSLTDGRGWEVCEALRALPGPRIGVLMVSGNAHEATDAARAAHGADGFVPKPVIEADLLAAIGACLGLQWRRAATGGPDDEPEPAAPSGDAVRELLALSAGGYPRALRARLAELAQESAATAAWVARIASLLESDPGALNAALGQALREPARG